MPLTMTVPIVAGWKLEAFYSTPGSKFDSQHPLFLHPRFTGIKGVTGLFPYTEAAINQLVEEALTWLISDAANASGLPLLGPRDMRVKKYKPDDVIIRVTFETSTLIKEVTGDLVNEAYMVDRSRK